MGVREARRFKACVDAAVAPAHAVIAFSIVRLQRGASGFVGALLVATGCAISCGGTGDEPSADADRDAGSDTIPTTDGATANDARSDPPDGADASAPEEPTIVPGAKDRVLLTGTIVTPDIAFEGQVLVEAATITCVAPGTACAARAGAAGATAIDTRGIIAPGLVDTHNHILFDIFDDDDWLPTKAYTNHDDWTAEPRYQAMLDVKQCLANDSQGKPAWCAQTPYGTAAGSLRCELDKYGELKGLLAGTTSIVGLPGTSAACFSSLARSIDVAQSGVGTDKVQTSALFPPSKSAADGVCANFTNLTTDAYLIHCGEGTDVKALGEFERLGTVSTTQGCLYAPQTAITHGTAFTATEFAAMAAAGMKLTWSPKSNVALYAATTDIPAALNAGLVVALAPDWSMGGSRNLLDEMRFAKTWSDSKWAGRLSSKDVVVMSTLTERRRSRSTPRLAG